MSDLITIEHAQLSLGFDPLLDDVNLQLFTGERVCLVGRNGAGKSTLMKVIEGTQTLESGEIRKKPHLRIARLAQELPQQSTATVYEFVSEGLAETGKLLAAYHALAQRISHTHSEEDLTKLAELQQAIDAKQGWQLEQTIETTLTRLQLDPEKPVASLSGGWQRRAALARALVTSPELLLLDEPTNHLDVEAIQWLEDQLLSSQIGLLFITHDRTLLQRLATRIIELDRGQLTSWPGDYENFLRRKEERAHAEALHNRQFDKKLAQEEQWIRQGIKARRTRNEGRVRALEALRKTRAQRRVAQGTAKIQLNTAEKSGRLVIDADQITYHIDGKPLVDDFSVRILRGDRVGLLGPNGIGKSTLLSLLLGQLTPDKGHVTVGTQLHIAYFDQLRQQLDPNKTVIENVAHGRDSVEINGKNRHIMSYLGDFLFTPQRAMTPVRALSGGECNRVLLARLFCQPSNLLVLDEPTNDLDIETLELLEDLLEQYPGTLLLVSHDRTFLDRVVTSTLVFEGVGQIKEYVGGYQDWLNAKARQVVTTLEKIPSTASPTKKVATKSKKTTLSYKEQQELAALPKKIEQLELEIAALQTELASPDFYQSSPAHIAAQRENLKIQEAALQAAYARWEALES